MKIGFDISQTAENKAGCGFYAEQIIDHLLQVDQTNKYLLYPVFFHYCSPEYKNGYRKDAPNCRNLFMNTSWREITEIWSSEKLDAELGYPDIIHSNNFSCPKGVKAKIVYTIHDVGFLDCPEYTTEENRLLCFNGAFEASIYADHIIAVSESTKTSFLRYFPYYPEERISVVYEGSRPSLAACVDSKRSKQILAKLGIEGDFWLAVGTIEPRKNYRLLLRAFSELVHKKEEQRSLVIAGGKGWMEEDIQELIKGLRISDRIIFAGYVTDEELSVLYQNCFGFVYPSNYEGFGLPVLEAMSCGAAVITSGVTSLPEVAGDAAIYIDPKSVDSLVEAMERLGSGNVRSDLKEKSIVQASKFSWHKAATEILQIYQKVFAGEPWLKTR